MPVPKRRTGKTKKNMRRSDHAVTAPNTIESPDSGEKVLPHRVCLKSGFSKGRQVIKVKD